MPGHVADRGQRLRLVELGETEVEEAHRDALVVREQDVRRLDVAVDDPAAVRVREPVEDLRRRLDRLAVAQLAGAHRVSKRPPADVLVGDVDVAGVGAEAVGAEAALVPQARCRLGLALRAVCGLALSRDDLQRDVETRLFVACEPDRAGASAAERPQRAVAVEDELPARERMCSSRHGFSWFGRRGTESFRASTAEPTVTVAPFHPVEAMSEREPDFEFDFFEEPDTREAAGRERTPRRPLSSRLGGGRGPREPRGPIRPRAGFTPLAAPARPDRLRDPDRRSPAALGAELPGEQEARRVRLLHDEHVDRRARVRACRP